MAKKKKTDPAATVALPVEAPPVMPVAPPDGEYHTITSLAALCNVTEQTVRRWVWYETIPQPLRYGRLVYWTRPIAEDIARRYLTGGAEALFSPRPVVEGKS